MKKIGLLTTLLVAGLLLSGCSFNVNVNDTSSVVDEDKPSIKTESGRLFACNEEVGKHYNITTFGGGWDIEHEDGTSFVLNGEITYEKIGETIVKNVQCVVDMVDNSVTILEIEEPVVEEPEVNDEEDGTILIPADGITYRNDEYGFQIKFGKERSGGKIYDSFRKYNIYNYNTDYDGGIKNPFIVFTVPSPRRTGKFENIADIIVYTYEEYEQERQNQMDPKCEMCSLEEFDKAIVGKNNKYYFLLGKSNRSDGELKTMFPSLECREETDSSVYGTYTYIYCDGIEYINGEPKKTGKNWIEQIMPAESFEFFDVKENAENNEFLEDIKSNGAQPQRINDYPEETENLNVLDITDKTMDTEYLINLTIGDKNFDVILENNSATRALYEKLKEGNVVINTKEYGGFEKVGNLGFSLPREDKQIKTQLGDLVLYNGNQVSLFYDSNSWSYTKLGKVQNITESDFGDGDITLTFSLKK